ncbi:hypothetical protein CYY_008752 [Polysphondylium violaceum]|uniref:THH1/TOM1/TOM3 domain-containing protein n=1 Tax=Polysphondylium violaceum TaxID=133409 RepID=A0A8J4PMN6_9MYCE|nr:hypothetical protein CYY_008752 [Polysphondylium violaceum]
MTILSPYDVKDSNDRSTSVFLSVEILAIILYTSLSVVCLFSLYKTFYRKESVILSRLFHIFICIFVSLRVVWYILRVATGEGPITFSLNTISFLFYLSGLLVVLFYWLERYHQTYVSTTEFLPKMKILFISSITCLYVGQIIILILFYTVNHQKREGSSLYLSNTLIQATVSLLIGVIFLLTILRTYLRFTNADKDLCRNQIQQVRKILLLSIIFSFCFLIRTIIFIYQPITEKYMNQEIFITFGYFIPDIIPTLVQIIIIHTNMKNEVEDNKFFNNLYDDENEMDDSGVTNDGDEDYYNNKNTYNSTSTPNGSIVDNEYDDEYHPHYGGSTKKIQFDFSNNNNNRSNTTSSGDLSFIQNDRLSDRESGNGGSTHTTQTKKESTPLISK